MKYPKESTLTLNAPDEADSPAPHLRAAALAPSPPHGAASNSRPRPPQGEGGGGGGGGGGGIANTTPGSPPEDAAFDVKAGRKYVAMLVQQYLVRKIQTGKMLEVANLRESVVESS